MSPAQQPDINALVELSILGGGSYRSRVEDAGRDRLTVAAPLNMMVSELPGPGTRLTVRWAAGARGRYAAPASVVTVHQGRLATWEIMFTAEPEIEQNRRFVRGGGGEVFRFRRALTPEDPAVEARIVDVSERSVRGRCPEVEVKAGDPAEVRLVLDDDVIDVTGAVLRVVEHDEPKAVDVVVVYEPDESQATVIRRYVLRQQMLARARTG